MTTIWKTELPIAPEIHIDVPNGAKFLSAREQHEGIRAWFLCDPDQPLETRILGVFPTGGDAPTPVNAWKFLGTASLAGGALIFHVFERAQKQ